MVERKMKLDRVPRRLIAFTTIVIAWVAFIRGETCLASTASVVESWKKQLGEIEQALRAKDYVTVEDSCSELAQYMMEKIGSGGSSAQMLALISAYRAIAATSQGHSDEGLWYWRTAQILYPGIDRIDLQAFGPIPERLKAMPFRGSFDDHSLLNDLPKDGSAKEPKPRRHPRAVYPQGMVDRKVEGQYRVQFVVDTDGTVKEPALVTAVKDPSLVYTLMDALRKWTFKPALVNGKPVALVVELDMTFDIRN